MAGKRVLKLEDMFELVSWSQQEEKMLVDTLIDYSMNEKLFGDGVQSHALNEIACQLTKTFGKQFSLLKVEKKFKSLKNRYLLWDRVTFWPGVRFNLPENRCEASESTWAAILEVHPSAKKYKSEGVKLWCELSLIFGGQVLSEYHNNMITSIRQCCEAIHADIQVCDIDDDIDLGVGVTDERSVIGISLFKCAPQSKLMNPGPHRNPNHGGDACHGKNTFRGMIINEHTSASSAVSSCSSSFWP